MDENTINNILQRIQSTTNPMGKTTDYPGVPSAGDDENYQTHRQIGDYSSGFQQSIESDETNEDYGVKTPSGKELLVDYEEDETEDDELYESVVFEQEEDEGIADPTEGTTGGETKKDDENEQYDSSEIGRIYELKKIYSRLLSVEGYLNVSNDEELMKLRSYTIQAIDLFKTMVYNLNKFMDQVDDIIVLYYNFLVKIYETIRKRLREIEEGGEKKKSNNKNGKNNGSKQNAKKSNEKSNKKNKNK